MVIGGQQLRIYLILKDRQPGEVHMDELKEKSEMNVAHYTSRISELRKKGFEITNTRPMHFKLVSEPQPSLEFLKVAYIGSKKLGLSNLMQRIVKKAQDMKFELDVKEAFL